MKPMPRNLSILALALAAAFVLPACDRAAEAPPPAADVPATPPVAEPLPPPPMATAVANIGAASEGGTAAGSLTVTADGDTAHITGSITGLAPDSEHGFHVHDTGDCSNAAGGSAGTHLNPGNQPHGAPDGAAHHVGDLPNLKADATGTAPVDVRVAGMSVGSRDDRDIVGRALVVHESADDYATQPSGGSGTPIACGVIELPVEVPLAAPGTGTP
jgi:Cu-Zn family superoxide dismutase